MSDDKMGTISRAMAVLTAIAEADDDVAIVDLAATLGLPQSTCHRLLDLLAADGFIERNPKLRRYRAGPNLQRIAALISSRTDLTALARPVMERLTEASGETSVLARFSSADLSLFFVSIVDAPHPLRYRIPLFEPVLAAFGASGRAAAAWLPSEQIEALYKASRAVSRKPPLQDREAFDAELEVIRARGYALSRGEKLDGAVGISAPILGSSGVVGSLSLTVPQQRFPEGDADRLGGLVRDSAAELSRLQGFLPEETKK